MKAKRRRRLVERGGLECFEIRIVCWFDSEGQQWTSVEVTAPEGSSEPQLGETLGAIEMGKMSLLREQDA